MGELWKVAALGCFLVTSLCSEKFGSKAFTLCGCLGWTKIGEVLTK